MRYNGDGTEVELAPRAILKKVLRLYAAKGWKPIIAPEVEFYLVSQNRPRFPARPADWIKRSGRNREPALRAGGDERI
jgi:glutamine synthetase